MDDGCVVVVVVVVVVEEEEEELRGGPLASFVLFHVLP